MAIHTQNGLFANKPELDQFVTEYQIARHVRNLNSTLFDADGFLLKENESMFNFDFYVILLSMLLVIFFFSKVLFKYLTNFEQHRLALKKRRESIVLNRTETIELTAFSPTKRHLK